MAKAVIGIVDSRAATETIVDRLRVAGFTGDNISVLMPDKTGTKDFAHEHATKAPEGTSAGVGIGGLAGGTVGYLAGIGALTIPGVGPLVAAGPIMAALSGAAVGGAVGGLTGALIGLGIPEFEAKQYAGKIKEGKILISVHTTNRDQVQTAKAVLKEAGASDVSTVREASVD
jgi:hypothetical protein